MSSGWKLVLGSVLIGGLAAQAVGQEGQVEFNEPPRQFPKQAGAKLALRQPNSAAPATVTAMRQTAPASGFRSGAMGGEQFNTWFNAYRGFSAGGQGRLATAESGQVELATGELTAAEVEAGAAEDMEFGALPSRQVRRNRPGVGRAISTGGSWFTGGSPFGIKYGYGSGFGYGGYGFDNPYGYGSRTGSGGAYSFGFAAYGSVGGQTGERLSGLVSGGGGVELGRLIGPEPPGMGAPAALERGAVGGTYTRSGAGSRDLGGSAAEVGPGRE